MPLARMASASSEAGPLKVLPAPSRTISAAEIRQAVTIREFDKAHRDHILRENRNA
jgi:hypothetical protein